MTLKARLILMVVALTTSVIVFAVGYFTLRNTQLLRETMDTNSTAMRDELISNARTLALNVGMSTQRAIVVSDFLFLQEIITNTVKHDSNLKYAIIMRSDGEALVHSNPQKTSVVLSDPAARFAREQMKLSQFEYRDNGEPILEIINPIVIGADRWLIRLGVSFQKLSDEITAYRQQIEQRIWRDIAVTGVGAMVLTMLAALIGFVWSTQLAKPLQILASAADSIAGGDLDTRVKPSGGSREIANLVSAFNTMSIAIGERDDAIRQNLASLTGEVSERKLAETKIRKLEHYLRSIIDSMPSELVAVDSNGRIVQWNREAERQNDIDADRAVGQPIADVFPQLAAKMPEVENAIAIQEPQSSEQIVREKKDDYQIGEVTIFPLSIEGTEGAVFRIDNITERVRLEQMMIQTEKMMSVGGLAAGMAHEINNPLSGILQGAQVMKTRFSTSLPKNIKVAEECGLSLEAMNTYLDRREVYKLIELMIDSGKRAAKIVANMLTFSRKASAEHNRCNLAELIDDTVELASNDFNLKKNYDFRMIEIVRQYDPNCPDVTCERGEIQQVLLNLLKNGAQAMAEVKSPERPPRFLLRLAPVGEMVHIEVEDNGPGMTPEIQNRVFEPFFTTKGVGVGTGLGLSVSFFIIHEQHQGQFYVESAPGKGAKFVIALPLTSPQTLGAQA